MNRWTSYDDMDDAAQWAVDHKDQHAVDFKNRVPRMHGYEKQGRYPAEACTELGFEADGKKAAQKMRLSLWTAGLAFACAAALIYGANHA